MKVMPIPQQLWGALGLMINHFNYAQITMGNWNPSITNAIDLLTEYHACFTAQGKVSQRGEIPQAWNPSTIFTPHRQFKNKECRYDQPLLPFGEGEENELHEEN